MAPARAEMGRGGCYDQASSGRSPPFQAAMDPPCDPRPPNAVGGTMPWGVGAGLLPGNVRRNVRVTVLWPEKLTT